MSHRLLCFSSHRAWWKGELSGKGHALPESELVIVRADIARRVHFSHGSKGCSVSFASLGHWMIRRRRLPTNRGWTHLRMNSLRILWRKGLGVWPWACRMVARVLIIYHVDLCIILLLYKPTSSQTIFDAR